MNCVAIIKIFLTKKQSVETKYGEYGRYLRNSNSKSYSFTMVIDSVCGLELSFNMSGADLLAYVNHFFIHYFIQLSTIDFCLDSRVWFHDIIMDFTPVLNQQTLAIIFLMNITHLSVFLVIHPYPTTVFIFHHK